MPGSAGRPIWLVAALAVAVGACSDDPVGGSPRAPASPDPAVSLSSLTAAPGQTVVVGLALPSRDGEASAVQGTIRWDPSSLEILGQVPTPGTAAVLGVGQLDQGRAQVLAVRVPGSPHASARLAFRVRSAGYGARVRWTEADASTRARGGGEAWSGGASPDPDPGLLGGVSRDPSTLRLLEWWELAPNLDPLLEVADGPQRVPGEADVFGDGFIDGAVNVLDVLYAANIAVGNRSVAECILGSDSPARDCVAVNVSPTNLPGLGGPGDACPPGVESACAGDRRSIDVLDVLLIANEAVGVDQPVAGELIPRTATPGDTVTLAGTLVGARVLAPDTIYRLLGVVHVGDDASAAELVIEQGTRLIAGANAALVVSRNGRVAAEGTRIRPIVFTCADGSVPGCWQGVFLNGNAPVQGTPGSPALPGRSAGGCAEVFGGAFGSFGGCAPQDSSGVLRHVRIEYAGQGGAALAVRGVGEGTILEQIYIHRSGGTGIEFTGGTARARWVRVLGARLVGLGWSGGWVGALQFAAIQTLASGRAAVEGRNSAGAPDALPRSSPRLRNVTVVGPAALPGAGRGAGGLRLLDGTDAEVEQFLFIAQPSPQSHVLDIDGVETWARLEAGGIRVGETLFVGYGRLGDLDPDPFVLAGYTSPDAEGQYLRDPAQDNHFVVSFADVEGALYGPWSAVPDLRAEPGGVVGVFTCAPAAGDPFFEAVAYCGALPTSASGLLPWLEPSPILDATPIPLSPSPGYLEYFVSSPELGLLPGVVVGGASGPTDGVTGLDGLYRSYTQPGPFLVVLSNLPPGCSVPSGTIVTLSPPVSGEEATSANYDNLGFDAVDCSGAVPP